MARPLFPDPAPARDPRKIAQTERVALLSDLALFQGVAKRHLKDLARRTRVEVFGPEQELFSEGQPSSWAYIIVAGTATVRRKGRKIAEVGPGDIVGEMGLLGDRPHSGSVRTSGPMECLVLDRAALKSAVTDNGALGWRLLTTVAERIAD